MPQCTSASSSRVERTGPGERHARRDRPPPSIGRRTGPISTNATSQHQHDGVRRAPEPIQSGRGAGLGWSGAGTLPRVGEGRQRLDEKAADRQGLKKFVEPKQERIRVAELLDDLDSDYKLRGVKSLPQIQSHVKPIRAHFATWRVVEITAEAGDKYLASRLKSGKAPATVNREMEVLSRALRLALERHKLAAIPAIRRLSESKPRQGVFESGDFEAVVAALPEHLRDMCRFGYACGWRRGEVVGLTWANVNRDRGVIRLEDSKNDHARELAMDEALKALIERRWAARLFPAPDGTTRVAEHVFHRDGEPLVDFRKAWASACKAAGIAGRLFHDLRRTAVSNMVYAGVPEKVAMEISGHRTRSVFDRYTIVAPDAKREAMKLTSAYVNAQNKRSNVKVLKARAK
jgi:integrase